MSSGYVLETPFSFSCPECGGVLRRDDVGDIKVFRCHIGHVLTSEAVLASQFAIFELKLAGALATLNERSELCKLMAADAHVSREEAAKLELASKQALKRAEVICKLLEEDWVQPVNEAEN
jgi:two-component system, chemotaxis family, protein-glutamate methylesterase/glutaminase